MNDFEHSLTVRAPGQDVFDFVADVRNMPRYLPTTQSAEPQGTDRVRMKGEVKGHAYDADGFLRPDRQNLRMEWGADEHHYCGWLQVEPQGDAAQVTVHLTFKDRPGQGGYAASDADIREGLIKSLESIRNLVEGRGGKVEPEAATAQTGYSTRRAA